MAYKQREVGSVQPTLEGMVQGYCGVCLRTKNNPIGLRVRRLLVKVVVESFSNGANPGLLRKLGL